MADLDSAGTCGRLVDYDKSVVGYEPLKLLLDSSRVGFRRRVPLRLLGSFSGGFGYEAPGTRVTLG